MELLSKYPMDYGHLIYTTLSKFGYDVVLVNNCFDPNYQPDTGWPLKLPDIEFQPNTLLALHFQDFVTPGYPVLELTKVEQHYGQHANQVAVVFFSHDMDFEYQGPLKLVELSTHNIETCLSIAQRRSDWEHQFGVPRDIAWQCLNGRISPHRTRAANVLKAWPSGVLSLGNDIPLDRWDYSTYRGTENDENFVRLAELYARTRFNIVTETVYDARPGVVSEKTFMAFVAKQIPIVIGHPGIVRDFQDLGFDMFEDLVDTSYDRLPNDQRLEQALALNKDLILGNVDLAPYQQRLEAQQDYILNKYVDRAISKFVEDCERVLGH